jgi:radical SAM superfamily enzyme YgiQ (UPF0313 family)
LFTKRGCAFSCSYCPYAKLEGKRYRLKTPERVLDEIRWVLRDTPNRRVTFSDNNFNAPIRHAKNLCRAFIRSGLDFQWSTGDLRPIGVTDELCRLMEDSGCYSANLAIESASESMLKRMKRGYSPRQVRASLETLSRSRIPFGASLMLGAPGETPETIAETLAVLDDYPIPGGVWVTVGVYLWTDYQDIVADARETGFLKDPGQLFSGAVYLSPGLSGPYLDKLCRELRARSGASNRYTVQVNKPEAEWTFERLPVTG